MGAFLLALVTIGALAHVAVRIKGSKWRTPWGASGATELEEQRRRLNIEIGMLKDPDASCFRARQAEDGAARAGGDRRASALGRLADPRSASARRGRWQPAATGQAER